ncbi:CoA ester lyase [Alkalicaulis satelles]|uniref:CoA ester lyase n=1 Tax=Alkalicaulis satelles TaxID=2609175 RepID=A0A5M6ZGT2_9PROT|nr:CoA ester lyase [Alkalicaulis satelles]KAA5803973.1 CoA ester lyase [Alkalicaulis satelles]
MRCLLFVPGSRPDRIAKALGAGADGVCVDLEDAVAPADKTGARAAVLAALAEPRAVSPRLGLRVNSPRTPAGLADLAALAQGAARPDFLMLPKVSHAEELAIVREALGGADCPALWPVVESAAGLQQAYAIAAAPGVEGVLFGGADFAADLGISLDWEPLLHARGTLVSASAAAGVALMDVPFLDVADEAGLIETTRRARALGFTGRSCIHPAQVAGVIAAFTPSTEELEHARAVLEAFEAAEGGAALFKGKLIELPVIRAARRTLAAAQD